MPGSVEPKVGVVVVHWGDPADTAECVRSVGASRLPARPLVVIDNGTGTIRPDAVRRVVPDAVVRSLPENTGFTGGSNHGLREALAAGATAVVLLNNDAVLAPEALGVLAAAAARVPRVGAVGAKVLMAADPTRVWATWSRLTWRAALVANVGQGEPDGPQFADEQDVDAVPGCAMLLTREAIDAVGLLDERFFAYHEDLDWCLRARAAGFRIRFAGKARVFHRGEGSLGSRGVANPVRYLSARNTVLFARKHARLRDWLRIATAVSLSLPGQWVRGRRRGEAQVLRLLLRGYRDGLLGREVPRRELGLV
jgi:hypothetical protein